MYILLQKLHLHLSVKERGTSPYIILVGYHTTEKFSRRCIIYRILVVYHWEISDLLLKNCFVICYHLYLLANFIAAWLSFELASFRLCLMPDAWRKNVISNFSSFVDWYKDCTKQYIVKSWFWFHNKTYGFYPLLSKKKKN